MWGGRCRRCAMQLKARPPFLLRPFGRSCAGTTDHPKWVNEAAELLCQPADCWFSVGAFPFCTDVPVPGRRLIRRRLAKVSPSTREWNFERDLPIGALAH